MRRWERRASAPPPPPSWTPGLPRQKKNRHFQQCARRSLGLWQRHIIKMHLKTNSHAPQTKIIKYFWMNFTKAGEHRAPLHQLARPPGMQIVGTADADLETTRANTKRRQSSFGVGLCVKHIDVALVTMPFTDGGCAVADTATGRALVIRRVTQKDRANLKHIDVCLTAILIPGSRGHKTRQD